MAIAIASMTLAACSSDDENKVDDAYKALSGISLTDWPLTDCSTSTRPVRDLVAYKLLDIPYKWEVDWMSGTTYIIQPDFSETEFSFSYSDYLAKNLAAARTEPIRISLRASATLSLRAVISPEMKRQRQNPWA